MSNTMVAQTVITPQLATAASMLIRIAQPQNQSLHRALARAEERLISQPWRIDAGVLRIVSFSRQNETHRTDGDYCECETKKGVCWHRAAWLICSTLAAAGCYAVADLPLPSVLDDDELPAESFLDGDFAGFDDTTLLGNVVDSLPDEDTFGGSTLGHDDYGDVLPARTAFFEEVDELPVYVPLPKVRASRIHEYVPVAGSAFARAQDAADQLFAA